MKRLLYLFVAICLLTGCTKNYKTVDEYENAMKEVRAKNDSLTIEAKQAIPMGELYYKSYNKGEKWKTELSMNGGSSYANTVLNDGKDVVSYAQGSPYAVVNPALEFMLEDEVEARKSVIASLNPVNPLINWENNIMTAISDETPEFIDNKANKNGFDCRMIKFSPDREACVSDKYGIAVYHKLQVEDPKNPDEPMIAELNLVNVDLAPLDDSTFELPSGVKKMDMTSMLEEVSKMFEGLKK